MFTPEFLLSCWKISLRLVLRVKLRSMPSSDLGLMGRTFLASPLARSASMLSSASTLARRFSAACCRRTSQSTATALEGSRATARPTSMVSS